MYGTSECYARTNPVFQELPHQFDVSMRNGTAQGRQIIFDAQPGLRVAAEIRSGVDAIKIHALVVEECRVYARSCLW